MISPVVICHHTKIILLLTIFSIMYLSCPLLIYFVSGSLYAEPRPRVGRDHGQEAALRLAGPDDPEIRPHGQRIHRVGGAEAPSAPRAPIPRGPRPTAQTPQEQGHRASGSGPQSSPHRVTSPAETFHSARPPGGVTPFAWAYGEGNGNELQ